MHQTATTFNFFRRNQCTSSSYLRTELSRKTSENMVSKLQAVNLRLNALVCFKDTKSLFMTHSMVWKLSEKISTAKILTYAYGCRSQCLKTFGENLGKALFYDNFVIKLKELYLFQKCGKQLRFKFPRASVLETTGNGAQDGFIFKDQVVVY